MTQRNGSTTSRLPEMTLEPGPWVLPQPASTELAYMVTAGMLLRRVTIEGGNSVELVGKGDLLLPWRGEGASFARSEWVVIDRARLAVLDLRPGSPLTRSTDLASTVVQRAIDRARWLSLQSAIMSIVGIEERLRALLWALAERWGEPVPGGAEIEVNVPQSVLAEMVGARRPTVSLALGALTERGDLLASEPGRWVLAGEPPEIVAAEAA